MSLCCVGDDSPCGDGAPSTGVPRSTCPAPAPASTSTKSASLSPESTGAPALRRRMNDTCSPAANAGGCAIGVPSENPAGAPANPTASIVSPCGETRRTPPATCGIARLPEKPYGNGSVVGP